MMAPENMKPGDSYVDRVGRDPVTVTILREREIRPDIFGRDMLHFWARRSDTGAEGYVIFGPGAYEREVRR